MIIVSLIFSIGADSSSDENINLKKVHDRILRLFPYTGFQELIVSSVMSQVFYRLFIIKN